MTCGWERLRRAMLGSLFVLAGALLVTLAVSYGRRFDPRAAERYADTLQSVLALHTELTAETLKSRSGLVPHYDGLVASDLALKSRYGLLRRPPSFLAPDARAGLLVALDASERAMRETAQLVERFKTENAVLRNSLLFLPVAALALDAFHDRDAAQLAFKEGANALVRDVLLLRIQVDSSILARVSRRLGELSVPASVAELGSPELSAQLALILEHARKVRAHAPVVDQLVRRIAEQPSVAPTERLRAAYEHQRALAQERASHDTNVLLGLLLLSVLAGALYVIARMRLSAARLVRASQELSQALASLREEQLKQRELSELKTRFVAMASHEFRTPLSAIMSSSELLEAYDQRWSAEKKAQHFGRIRGSVLGMTRMLEAILLIGRTDAGKLEFKPCEVDLNRLCNDALEQVGRGAKPEHRIELTLGVNGPIYADETLLRHVIENLLSNAIKYSPAGGRVALSVQRAGGELLLEVSDQGIGIPARDRERLFEAFHRAENVAGLPGTGLGLSVVKRAVDLHGGTVEVESIEGAGTCFRVRVPCTRQAA